MLHLFFLRCFQVVAAAYAFAVLGWALTQPVLGDATWWLFIINAFSVYLFVPGPLLLLMAFALRRRLLFISLGLVLMAGLYGHGWALVPKFLSAPTYDAPSLRVMTFNTLFVGRDTTKTVQAIQAANADVIALQELNPLIAQALQRELIDEYPYQTLAPSWQPNGMGTISRYPLTLTQQRLGADGYVGQPQMMTIDFRGTPITVINVHTTASTIDDEARMMQGIRARTAQIEALAAFARSHRQPLVVLADMNATPTNDGYAALAATLTDSWREVGWGLGHTYPNEVTRGARRWGGRFAITVRWLIRIDYVWHSRHFGAVHAETGPFDEQSDHRPLVVDLVFAP